MSKRLNPGQPPAAQLAETTDQLPTPSRAQRDEAVRDWGSARAHARFAKEWPCMTMVEVGAPVRPAPAPSEFTVAAWNMERCKHVEASAALIAASGADIVLATEMDFGMARSGQKHTTQQIAQILGFGYAYAVEYVELSAGDRFETADFAGMEHQHGLHGNAILSRWPLSKVARIALDEGGLWYVSSPKDGAERRVGGRMAIAAQIQTARGPLTFAATHFESETDANGREQQMTSLMQALDALYGPGPCILGGDFNTFSLRGNPQEDTLAQAEASEPAFVRARKAGFEWQTANVGAITTRHYKDRPVTWEHAALDWLFTRKVEAKHPSIVAAVGEDGAFLSDHELISARIHMLNR